MGSTARPCWIPTGTMILITVRLRGFPEPCRRSRCPAARLDSGDFDTRCFKRTVQALGIPRRDHSLGLILRHMDHRTGMENTFRSSHKSLQSDFHGYAAAGMRMNTHVFVERLLAETCCIWSATVILPPLATTNSLPPYFV